jgi:ubiquinone/menaquinone biosynthesis C-methylase UbiE/uncharacterized protein YbaR (Trm112 family)
MKYAPEIIVCPRCSATDALQENGHKLLCRKCRAAYRLESGIPNLLADATLKTALEKIDYDSVHGISPAGRQETYKAWEELFGELSLGNGRVLEIGSGTGNLTWGLMHRSSFDEVYATDLSAKYLNYIANNFSEGSKNRTYYYICDANQLPFKENSFEAVVGHSVLHHLLNYEKTLQAVKNILTNGGYAIFFEPILQGKIFVSFMIDLIQRLDQSFGLHIFTNEERKKIIHQVKHHTKDAFIKGDKNILKGMEDKYIFDVNKLSALSAEAGYSRFQIRPHRKMDVSYRSYVAFQLSLLGIEAKKLDRFAEVFAAFGGTVGLMLGDSISTPMCFLIFKK